MQYSICVTPTAVEDITVAVEYYNSLAHDLGYRFADVIDEYFERIALFPTSSEIRYKNIRCKPVKRFPFLITFTIDEINQTVNILRVFNTYQEPLW
jgi:toxin ParE1/3/4